MDKLLPYGLGFLLVLAVLLWLVRGFFGEWVKKAGERSFSRLFSGKGWVGGRKLLGYRKAVGIDYGKHALGFFRTEPISLSCASCSRITSGPPMTAQHRFVHHGGEIDRCFAAEYLLAGHPQLDHLPDLVLGSMGCCHIADQRLAYSWVCSSPGTSIAS